MNGAIPRWSNFDAKLRSITAKRRDLSQTAALFSKKNYTLLIIKPNT